MPTPSKTTNPAAKPEKPKGTGRFITATEGWRIVQAAKNWKGTPYGTGKYKGGGAVKGKAADCSGATWKIYAEAGFPYGRYFNTVEFVNLAATDSHFIVAWLKDLVGRDASFVKGTHFFKEVFTPQVGDIGWWNGHMAIYDNNAGKTEPEGAEGDLWSARSTDFPFGPSRIKWFNNYVDKKTGKNYGIVKWYRYWIAP